MREIKPNKLYKHFKGEYYFTLGVSNPVNVLNSIGKYKFIRVKNTETHEEFDVLLNLESKQIYHNQNISGKTFVIYRNAYLNTGDIWAREIEVFSSKVDKEKYPEHEGKNRFEEVK